MWKIKILIFSLALVLIAPVAHAGYSYSLMEPLPGQSSSTCTNTDDCFVEYIQKVYNFFMISVGISALFMITLGGFTYLGAAGNTSKTEDGKKMITNALIGLGAVLCVTIIFNLINPDLVNLHFTGLQEITLK